MTERQTERCLIYSFTIVADLSMKDGYCYSTKSDKESVEGSGNEEMSNVTTSIVRNGT